MLGMYENQRSDVILRNTELRRVCRLPVTDTKLRGGTLYNIEMKTDWANSFLEAESTPQHMVPPVASEKNPRHDWGSIPRPSD